MKHILLIAVCMTFSGLSFGQNSENETIKKVQTLEQLKKDAPSDYKAVLEYASTHGSAIVNLPQGKDSKLNGSITMDKSQLIDPLKMGLTIPTANQYYRIEGTDKMLVVKSLFTLQEEMKNKR